VLQALHQKVNPRPKKYPIHGIVCSDAIQVAGYTYWVHVEGLPQKEKRAKEIAEERFDRSPSGFVEVFI
jgi:hypothetical protein